MYCIVFYCIVMKNEVIYSLMTVLQNIFSKFCNAYTIKDRNMILWFMYKIVSLDENILYLVVFFLYIYLLS